MAKAYAVYVEEGVTTVARNEKEARVNVLKELHKRITDELEGKAKADTIALSIEEDEDEFQPLKLTYQEVLDVIKKDKLAMERIYCQEHDGKVVFISDVKLNIEELMKTTYYLI